MNSHPRKRKKTKLEDVAFGRTPLGQAVYDVYMSSMSAAECVRRHPELTREQVLRQRNSKVGKELRRKREACHDKR